MTGTVFVVGSLNIDLVLSVAELPGPGETVLGLDTVRRPGGKGANQAIAAATAGARTRLLGRIGAHDEGPGYRSALAERGVDVSGVIEDATAGTGLAIVAVSKAGENLIIVSPGANANLATEDVTVSGAKPDDVLLLQLEIPIPTVLAAARTAHAAGATVVLNLSPYQPAPDELLTLADLIVVNTAEHDEMPETRRDRPGLVVTSGASGARWDDLTVPARSAEVIDTTGAGDAFAGTLAAGIATGLPRAETLRRAVDAGSAAVTYPGAQPWQFPT